MAKEVSKLVGKMVFNDSFGLIFIHQNQNGFCLDNSLYRVYYSVRAKKKCLQR